MTTANARQATWQQRRDIRPNAQTMPPMVEDALAKGAKVMWRQPGTLHTAAPR